MAEAEKMLLRLELHLLSLDQRAQDVLQGTPSHEKTELIHIYVWICKLPLDKNRHSTHLEGDFAINKDNVRGKFQIQRFVSHFN